jgi:phosphatidylglycerol:prolipoprotein diacylglycerol transferase
MEIKPYQEQNGKRRGESWSTLLRAQNRLRGDDSFYTWFDAAAGDLVPAREEDVFICSRVDALDDSKNHSGRKNLAMIPFLHLGPLTVPTYGLMVALAMVVSFYVLRADMARRGLALNSESAAETFIAIPCLAGIVGAKLYHVFETPADLFADPWHQIFSQFGFAWFGGLIAGFAAFVLLARHYKIPLLEMLDAGSPAAALGYGIGRIGCLLSGDGDYGIPTSLPWGMSFPNALVPTTERVHPTPIYELIAACAIAWFLWRLGGRAIAVSAQASPHTAHSDGRVFAGYLVLTGVARFLVEIIRINPRSFLGMSNAQAASVISVVAGAVLWWRSGKGN